MQAACPKSVCPNPNQTSSTIAQFKPNPNLSTVAQFTFKAKSIQIICVGPKHCKSNQPQPSLDKAIVSCKNNCHQSIPNREIFIKNDKG